MRAFYLLLTTLLFYSCQQDNFEEFPVPLDNCEYSPFACSLITLEQFIDICGSTPEPISNTYASSDGTGLETVKTCQIGFRDQFDDDFQMKGTLRCEQDIENSRFTDLTEASSYPNNVFDSEHAFEHAIYYPDLDVYIVRQDNYVLEIDFQNLTKDQQIEVVTIMLNNLP